MRKFGTILLVAILAGASARPAFAILQFYQQFDKVYLAEHENKEFVEQAHNRKNQCLICHQGKVRKNHNAYGLHLVELLDKRKDARDVEKIKEALAKVGAMHSDPNDDKSPTYDELIKQGKFPGGSLEDLNKEPEQ